MTALVALAVAAVLIYLVRQDVRRIERRRDSGPLMPEHGYMTAREEFAWIDRQITAGLEREERRKQRA